MSEWRPIESAPRDGLPVLLCTDGGIVFVGKLNKHLQLWVDDEGRERFRTVSYWMPLPQPPEAALRRALGEEKYATPATAANLARSIQEAVLRRREKP